MTGNQGDGHNNKSEAGPADIQLNCQNTLQKLLKNNIEFITKQEIIIKRQRLSNAYSFIVPVVLKIRLALTLFNRKELD